MLLKHTFQYVLARGAPGLVNFLAIVLYTRLVSPESYGLYALAVTGVSFCTIVFCQWVQLALLRFYPARMNEPSGLLAALLTALGLSCLPVVVGGFALLAFIDDETVRLLVVIAVPLICVQAWFDLNLELARSRLDTLRYGVMSSVKAIAGLGAGLLLVHAGLGPEGLLAGLLLGCLVAVGLAGVKPWRAAARSMRERDSLRPYLAYGLPLTMTFALAFVISGSDRLLLTYFLGADSTGIYAAGYDLVWNVLTLLFVVVNLAAYPLVVRALETQGEQAAKRQCAENGTLLLLVGIPTTALLTLLAPEVSRALLGAEYRDAAAYLIPWIAVSALIAGLRAYHFDLAFQLSQKTYLQVWILGVAATVNLGANLWLIPRFGTIGAAYATFFAYAVSLAMSVLLGRRCFRITLQWSAVARILVATMVAMLAVLVLPAASGPVWLVLTAAAAGITYIALVLALDVLGLRALILSRLKAR